MIKLVKVKSIKAKLIIPIVLLVLLLVTFFLVKAYQSELLQFTEGKHSSFRAEYNQVRGLMDDTAVTAYCMAELVAGMPEVQKCFSEKDRQRLLELTLPLYRSAREKLSITQFQFHLPPAISFLRLHKVQKYGDDLSGFRFTVLEANQEQRPRFGIEKGRFGLGLRGVAPVVYQGKHIGTVEFGLDVNDKLLAQVKEKNNIDVAVLVPDGEGFKVQAQTGAINLSSNIYSALRRVMETDQAEIKVENKDNRRVMTFLSPLKDFSGRNVGVVVLPSDITSHINQMKQTLFIYVGGGVLLVFLILGVVYFAVEFIINRPVKNMIQVFDKAGEGALTDRVKIEQDDEMAELGKGFNTFLDKIQQMLKDIADNSKRLASSSGELFSVSRQMSSAAEGTSGKADTVAVATEEMSANMRSVAAAAEEASTNVSMVAAATEEMTSTISGIAQHSEKARDITHEAVSQAKSASERVNKLGKAADEIGKVTEAITEISEQTNLLALNATIEAARAGEAGKGFAVVATEIKELAKQTASATLEIKEKINGIQDSTAGTVTEIEQISKVINDVNEIVVTIAAAVEEQSVTSREIVGNIAQASQGIQEVTENVSQSSAVSGEIARDISEVNQAASEMSSSSSQVSVSAEDLSGLSEQLKEMVERFRV